MKKRLLIAAALLVSVSLQAQVKVAGNPAPAGTTIFQSSLLLKNGEESTNISTQKAGTQKNELVRCYTVEVEEERRKENPSLPGPQEFEQWIGPKIKEYKAAKANSRAAAVVYKIPVVVHVVHNGEPVGQGANITAAQVYSQIDVLTEDFRRKNADAVNTRAIFLARAADFEIEFVPATIDPNGNLLAEPGIHRYNGGRAAWDLRNDIQTILKPATSWNPAYYCNMWTMQFGTTPLAQGGTGGLLGYAQFPESGLPGMSTATQSSVTDGLVMGYQYFGSSAKDPGGIFNLSAPYDLGRTTTHEIGHWIGLRHIWGDGNCGADDFVTDTPNAAASNYNCDQPAVNSCGAGTNGDEPDMTENYMDYSSDGCMNMLTQGQKDRAISVMLNSPRRKELPSSPAAAASYSDAGITKVSLQKDCDGNISGTAILTNYATGAALTSVVINIEVNGTLASTRNWTGNLAALGSVSITLPTAAVAVGTHNVRVYTSMPNGTQDTNTPNDAQSASITYTKISGNYAQNFETGTTSLNDFVVRTNGEAGAGIAAEAARASNFGLYLEGKSALGYPAAPDGPSDADAFNSAHSHYTSATICYDATNASNLSLSFDFFLNYGIQNAYTSFRYRIVGDKGTPFTSQIYRPAGADKAWATITADLTQYAGGKVQIIFEANCKYARKDLNGVAGDGNAVFIDNIALTYTTSLPEIKFAAATGTASEASATTSDGGCRTYTDYVVNLIIANAPSADATVQVSATGGTATATSDYTILTPTVVFPAGLTTARPVSVRVYDDNQFEGSESLQLGLALSGTSNAVLSQGERTHSLTITDNDNALAPSSTSTIFTESFTSGATGWSALTFTGHNTQSRNEWFNGNMWSITGNSAYVTNGFNKTTYDKTRATDIAYRSPVIDAANLVDLTVGFYYGIQGEAGSDYGQLLYALEGSTTYTIIDGPYHSTGKNATTGDQIAYWREVVLPASLNGKRFHLAWNFMTNANGTGTDPGLVIDDITVTGIRNKVVVATELNAQKNYYLGPFATVHYYDQTTGKLIASIENTSSWDFGCTTIQVDRSGTTGKEFWAAGMDKALTDKTVYVTPTNNYVSGAYNITLYYTEAEIAGWELATGRSRTQLQVAKISGAHVYQVSPTAMPTGAIGYLGTSTTSVGFGKDWSVKAAFTSGFSGFGIGMPGPPPTTPQPVELLSFNGTGNKQDIVLSWATASEKNSAYYEIEHSYDGTSFAKIGTVAAAGNSSQRKQYGFTHQGVSNGRHYYRLRIVDQDATFEYSSTISVTNGATANGTLKLHPNPAHGTVKLDFTALSDGPVSVTLISASGTVVASTSYTVQRGSNQVEVDLQHLATGLYLVQLNDGVQLMQQKLIVR